ncbi:MAG TPA: Cna B-type domain-containing protein [Clostridiales bacterium]|nr:Cna B-type domain-containing protein [Clostridiales bacterium]
MLTNKYDGTGPEGELLDVTVKKTWVDEDGETISEKLPADLAIKLTGTDTNEYEHTLVPNADGEWTHTFKDLYKFDSTGTAIVYTPSETVPNGYTLTSTVEAPDYTFTLTNTYDGVTDNTDPENPEETPVDVTVKKVWLDEDDKPITENLPAKLAIKVTGGEADLTADLTAAGTWTHTFKELKKFGTDGEAFVYEASETVPNGYTLTSTVENPDYTFTLTNTYDGITDNTDPENPEETPVDITATKEWKGIPDGTKTFPKAEITLYQNGEAHGTPIELTATGNGKQEAKWEKLLKYAPDSSEYVYTVMETTVPNGYVMVQDGLVITNTYDGLGGEDPVVVSATKEWKGIPKGTKTFPKAVITLYQNGEAHGTPIELTATGDGKQEAKWDKLLKFAPDGTDFTYTVKETEVPKGYKMEQKGLDITNTFVPPYIPEDTITVLLGSGLNNNLGDCVD